MCRLISSDVTFPLEIQKTSRAAGGLLVRLHVLLQALKECIGRHHASIDTATCTHGYGLRLTLLVPDNQQIGDLLQRVLAYFIANLLVAQIALYSNPLFLQRLGQLKGIFRLVFSNIQDHSLYWREPRRHRTSVVLDQNAEKTFHGTDNSPVQHHGTLAAVVFSDIFGSEPLRQHHVELQRAALPRTAKRVLDVIFDLRTVKSAFARQLFPRQSASGQRVAQALLAAIPRFVRSGSLVRTQRQLDVDAIEAEILVHAHGKRIEGNRLLDELIFRAENVCVVLNETTHAHKAVQCARSLIAMARAKFGITQRQIAIRTQAVIEHLNVTGAVHRLDRVVALFRLCREHAFAVILPMPGRFPQRAVHDHRRLDLKIADLAQATTHVLLDLLPDRPALGVPEHHARRFFLQME